MNKIGLLYDTLWDSEGRQQQQPYAIHKRLELPRGDSDLVDWLLNHVHFQSREKILDAGCGTGNTLFKLHKSKGIIGTGLSLSAKEIEFARDHAKALGVGTDLHFQQKDFNETTEGQFDKAIAIESLKHSKRLSITLKNLHKSLVPGGLLIIADDFLLRESRLAEKQRHAWHAPAFLEISQFRSIVEATGFQITKDHDLTLGISTKSTLLLATVTSLLKVLVPLSIGKLKRKLQILQGALILELLYKHGVATYHMILAKKI